MNYRTLMYLEMHVHVDNFNTFFDPIVNLMAII